MCKLGLISQVYGKKGYTLDIKLTDEELNFICKLINIQWLYRLQLVVPQYLSEFKQIGIENYHKLSHLLDHSMVWTKASRVFPNEVVEMIKSMNFFLQLQEELGEIKIADEEQLGWENIYSRLVQPGKNDIGSLHADK